ncbi:MAG TPA: hypothetical protein DHV28_13325 [Ignavibacteriales bacterium]|nr:hypothetical protein [Ignavibacteriales bacterium]
MLTRSKLNIAFLFPFLPLLFGYQSPSSSSIPQEKIIPLTKWYYLAETGSDSSNIKDITSPETLASEKWKPLSSTASIMELYKGKIVWIRTKLPVWQGNYPTIYIGHVSYNMQLFLNNKMIYQVKDFDQEEDKYIRWSQVLIKIPEYKNGDELIIKIIPGDKTAVIFENAVFGSATEIIRSVFKSNFIYLMIIAIIFITGTAAIIAYFTLMKTKILIYLMLFLLSAGVLISVNNSFLQLVINKPALFYNLNYIFLNIGSIILFLMIEIIVLKKYKIIINIIWKFKVVFLIFTMTILSLTNLIFNDILKYFILSSIVFLIIATVTLLLSTSKNKYEGRILYAGISAVLIFSFIEIILMLNRGIGSTYGYAIKTMPFGFLLFVGTIFWYAIHDYLQTIKEKENSKQLEFEAIKRENENRFLFAKRLIDSQENERNRIALELHDSVGQKLLLVKNLLLSRNKKSFDDIEKKFLYGVNDLTQETINEIRNIIYNLRPQHLDQLGLSTAIETLVENLSVPSEINFVLNIDKIDDFFTKPDEIYFFRILQECLNNIIKHSNAKDAFIDIKKRDGFIFMQVKDNGKSDKKNKNSLNGMGLAGIRERSKIIGAELNLDINGEEGTTVILKYPIKQDFLHKEENG